MVSKKFKRSIYVRGLYAIDIYCIGVISPKKKMGVTESEVIIMIRKTVEEEKVKPLKEWLLPTEQ